MKWNTVDFEKLTPMMQHYVSIKRQYPDCIVMYRLGDFYEMFFDDAELASRVLEVALTARDCGLEERAPMAGVPHHVVDSYISKLVSAGYKVAIVDQMEDANQAEGLVKRSVTRIITPGTLTDSESLDQGENNYLMAVYFHGNRLGLSYADISTGEIRASEVGEIISKEAILNDWITTVRPSEILFIKDEEIIQSSFLTEEDSSAEGSENFDFIERKGIFLTNIRPVAYDFKGVDQVLDQYMTKKSRSSLSNHLLASISLASLLDYVYTFQDEKLDHLNNVEWIQPNRVLRMNASTREHLEIHYNLEDRSKRNSLLGVLDKTETAMGSRLLNQWLELPLVEIRKIEERQEIVQFFVDHVLEQKKLEGYLAKIYDLERLLSKFSYNRGNARDMISLQISLEPLPQIKELLLGSDHDLIKEIGKSLDLLEDIRLPIENAIVEDPPLLITEGGLIKKDFNEKLDEIRGASEKARQRLIEYEQEERERTGIKNLKIVFRKNTGYFIEITKGSLDKVPDNYRRRQTLKNSERFITEELELQEGRITGNKQEIYNLEYEIFQELRTYIGQQSVRIQETAHTLASLDVLQAFAKVASNNQYVRPVFTDKDEIEIINGRHPVVEKSTSQFIPNDLKIGQENNRIQIITGPNMAGKSTYMRQNALIIIMAQAGAFVPCESCSLPITDQIFTRIGASDNLASGDSTFMVEMKEMASILRDASPSSFLVLDEVGRGTSTNDGLSIAYAIVEYLSKHMPAKTLFATHYHELTALSDEYANVQNRKVDIEEDQGELIFLRKVVPGKADRSYGIEVARLSGLPQEILDRASYLLSNIDAINDLSFLNQLAREEGSEDTTDENSSTSYSTYQKDRIINDLQNINMNELNPMDAMNKLYELVERSKDVD